MTTKTLTFVSSAYNEAASLPELYRRCRLACSQLQAEFAQDYQFNFRLLIADNSSNDDSLVVLGDLVRQDANVMALANLNNYGPEASAANALLQAGSCDLVVLLCSDLQDPPELATTMVQMLVEKPEHDAVLAVKTRSSGNALLRLARRTYYKALGYSSRFQMVPGGFHGFGCYRREVVEDALQYWQKTDLNLRQCLVNACRSPLQIGYRQADRLHGSSSYRGWGYWPEALRSLISSDAAASRLALLIGSAGLALSLVVGVLLLANVLRGSSGYSGGIPTVMGLVLLSFAVQMLMFALLSRQIEALRMGGFRPKVRFRVIGASAGMPMGRHQRSQETDPLLTAQDEGTASDPQTI